MSCTDKFNATRKLRERERKREKERERGRERERAREKERENGQNGESCRSLTFAFNSVSIQLQLSNYKQTTISEAQKKAKTLFSVYRP
jgi:hypothetical protein